MDHVKQNILKTEIPNKILTIPVECLYYEHAQMRKLFVKK